MSPQTCPPSGLAEAGKGLVWSLYPKKEQTIEEIMAEQRPSMSELAKKLRGRYFVTSTDTVKFKDSKNMAMAQNRVGMPFWDRCTIFVSLF